MDIPRPGTAQRSQRRRNLIRLVTICVIALPIYLLLHAIVKQKEDDRADNAYAAKVLPHVAIPRIEDHSRAVLTVVLVEGHKYVVLQDNNGCSLVHAQSCPCLTK